MLNRNGSAFSSAPRRHKGIALLEAVVALAIAVAGVLALMGLNARVAGTNITNRISSAAMLAAQAKLEELRNTPFASLADGNDYPSFKSPGIAGQHTVALDRCWTLTNVGAFKLKLARVSAVRQGGGCNSAEAVTLTTLIAEANPRQAAVNAASFVKADGEAKVTRNYVKPSGSTEGVGPSGFKSITQDGKLIAVVDPDTGTALEPLPNTSLGFVTINGNVLFDGERTFADFKKLQIRAEGNAICRKFYPGYDPKASTPPDDSTTLPSISGGGAKISYVQYACIVPNEWRRSISVLTGNLDTGGTSTDKVCVGSPDLQSYDSTNKVYTGTDILASEGRAYFGFKIESGQKEPSGMRGTTDGASRIGSVCESGQNCWKDESEWGSRGWVPGGHHFFVMSKTGGLCAQKMNDLFTAIDNSNAGRGGTGKKSVYYLYLDRNPHLVYCTNTKAYTRSLTPIPFGGTNFSSTDCYSYTKFSGFITPGDSLELSGKNIQFGTTSTFGFACSAMGAFGASGASNGGGYACGYPEDTTNIAVTPYVAATVVFAPGGYSGYAPDDATHDFVNYSFEYRSAGGSCPPINPVTWKNAAQTSTCEGAITTTGTDGSTTTVSSTNAGVNGSAIYQCTAATSTWNYVSGSCNPVSVGGVPCPADSTDVTWMVGTNTCSGKRQETPDGANYAVINTKTGFEGGASYQCANGTWGIEQSTSCAKVETCGTLEVAGSNNSCTLGAKVTLAIDGVVLDEVTCTGNKQGNNPKFEFSVSNARWGKPITITDLVSNKSGIVTPTRDNKGAIECSYNPQFSLQ